MKAKLLKEVRILDGVYREYSPSNLLKKYINKYYITEGFNSLHGKKIHIINKCNVEMVIHYGEEKINFFDNEAKKFVKKTAMIIGGHKATNLREYKISGEIKMFTVEFNYIGILKLLSVYPIDIIDSVIDIEDIFGNTAHELLNEFFNDSEDSHRISLIEDYFIQILNKQGKNFCKENLLLECMDIMVSSNKSIKKICEDLEGM